MPSRSVRRRRARRPRRSARQRGRTRDGRRCCRPPRSRPPAGRRRSSTVGQARVRAAVVGHLHGVDRRQLQLAQRVGLSASAESRRSKPAGAHERRHRARVGVLRRRPGRPRRRRDHAITAIPPDRSVSGAWARRRRDPRSARGLTTLRNVGSRGAVAAVEHHVDRDPLAPPRRRPPWWSRDAWVMTSTDSRAHARRAAAGGPRGASGGPPSNSTARAVGVLDQRGVALADVEEGDRDPVRRRRGAQRRASRQRGEHGHQAPQRPPGARAAAAASAPPAAAAGACSRGRGAKRGDRRRAPATSVGRRPARRASRSGQRQLTRRGMSANVLASADSARSAGARARPSGAAASSAASPSGPPAPASCPAAARSIPSHMIGATSGSASDVGRQAGERARSRSGGPPAAPWPRWRPA